jgi:prepilin-type N-terminal cleavage/methylation domain-containing protein
MLYTVCFIKAMTMRLHNAVTERMKRSLEALAAAQEGFFTSKQTTEIGYSAANNSLRCREGQWLKVDHGLYRLPFSADTYESRVTRWLLWSRDRTEAIPAVASHESALYLHGLLLSAPEDVHLSVPNNFRKEAPLGGCILHSTDFLPGEIIKSGLVMYTSVRRALADLHRGRGIPRGVAERAEECGLLNPGEARMRGWTSVVRSDAFVGGKTGESKCREGGIMLREQVVSMDRGAVMFMRTRTGFTLVELLVVVAILSILAALLMPMMGKAIATARQIDCLNRLRQLGTATQIYADGNRDWLPLLRGLGSPAINNWPTQLVRVLGSEGDWQSWERTGGQGWSAAVDEGLRQIFRCPEGGNQYREVDGVRSDCYLGISYGYNQRLGNYSVDHIAYPGYSPAKLGRQKPTLMLFADTQSTNCNRPFEHEPHLSYRHDGGCCILFADNSASRHMQAETIDWTYTGPYFCPTR